MGREPVAFVFVVYSSLPEAFEDDSLKLGHNSIILKTVSGTRFV